MRYMFHVYIMEFSLDKCVRSNYTIYLIQGDDPDNLYLVLEGTVKIIKNVHIVNTNR